MKFKLICLWVKTPQKNCFIVFLSSHKDFKEKSCSFAKLFYFTEAYKERIVLKYKITKKKTQLVSLHY